MELQQKLENHLKVYIYYIKSDGIDLPEEYMAVARTVYIKSNEEKFGFTMSSSYEYD